MSELYSLGNILSAAGLILTIIIYFHKDHKTINFYIETSGKVNSALFVYYKEYSQDQADA